MIQEAHVGLGIFGKEGRQAARTADYAFSRFRYVHRVLLMHGHYYYVRIANLVLYFFYKNIAFVMSQFYFIFFSAYSANVGFLLNSLLQFKVHRKLAYCSI